MGKMEDYEAYWNTYNARYGPKVAVLYQIGKFHEIYGIDNGTEKVGNVSELAAHLNIKETRVHTAILENSRENPQMAGFNSVALDANVDKLVLAGYTVVVVDQIPNTKPIRREVSTIRSPGTNIGTEAPTEPYLVSVYIDSHKNRALQRSYYYLGLTAIDVTTGQSVFFETNSTPTDSSLACDDLVRFLQTFVPVELIINGPPGQDLEVLNPYLPTSPTTYRGTGATLEKVSHQEEYLRAYFKSGPQSVLEYLRLERSPAATKAFVHMLQFCVSYNTQLAKGLQVPQSWSSAHNMTLDSSSVAQLGIMSASTDTSSCIFSKICRYVRTSMGRRVLRERLTGPIIDPETLEARYDAIEAMTKDIAEAVPQAVPQAAAPKTPENLSRPLIKVKAKPQPKAQPQRQMLFEHVREALTGVKDIERYHRKLILGLLSPSELYMLDLSYVKILALAQDETLVPFKDITKTLLSDITQFRARYTGIIDMSAAGRCTVTENMKNSIFVPGYNSDIDLISAQIREGQEDTNALCDAMSELTGSSKGCKYVEDEAGECYVSMSKPQYRKFRTCLEEAPIELSCGTIEVSDLQVDDRNKSNVKIKLTLLSTILDKRTRDIAALRDSAIRVYATLLETLAPTVPTEVGPLVGQLDLYSTLAFVATSKKYCRPQIKGPGQGPGSYLWTQGLRHPLVEEDYIYVPQDINLSQEPGQEAGRESHIGMLLYGVNQSGKSCTMKSVGVALVLAQAGFYVPAQSFQYWPYETLMTRILGNDNIDKGLSTFAIEMMELRGILTRCNSRSLVLGDEVCHGTESASAVSLVAASLMHMSAMKTSFIFATHLHELSRMEEVKSLKNVGQYHLTISFGKDSEGHDTIIYDRGMKPGSGLGLYGIEVAKHLRLPEGVLADAYHIRNKYFGTGTASASASEPDGIKDSRYNASVAVWCCRIPGCMDAATDTHHIRAQAEADRDGMIGHIHKNHPKNLVPLCKRHHNDVHNGQDKEGELIIFGYGHDGNIICEYRPRLATLN